MGWNPIRDIGNAIGGAVEGATDWLKNPSKETQAIARRVGSGAQGLVRQIKKDPVGSYLAGGTVLGGQLTAAKNALTGTADKFKPGSSAQLTALRKDMTNEAKNFQRNIGQYRADQYQGLLNAANEARDVGTKKIREGMSSRGLLFSGLRAGKESELQSGLESGLAQGRYDINRESSALLKKKQLAAQMVGLDQMAQMQAQLENYYNLQMQNQLARRQAFGQLAQGIGYAAGSYYGNKSPGGGTTVQSPGQINSYWNSNPYSGSGGSFGSGYDGRAMIGSWENDSRNLFD